ncbi:MAG: peptidylprolyl isomerase [Betaproteobacteria bacterium]|nr:peptidylprolyl isomerase [Pseudomonadota bacterium]NBO02949.1 peptidylprolyl isomerase [Betaproteobacteria bacterium]NBO94312.1 peptidylprolyl isomerase [Betaproteobacteria bacterium]NBP34218.1 peptidylprolyl isomerase [Betaproteobacteria bacterium]NBP38130.1 peptidylprolyl isomerase [Betaproteobacteria bacterium]
MSDDKQIACGQWVSLRYRIYDSLAEAIEPEARTLVYLYGVQKDLFPKIEQALEGLEVNARLSLYLEPSDTFGDYDETLIHLVSRDLLPSSLEAGMSFEGLPGETSDGLLYTVTDFTDEIAVLDGNHPLAGMGLRFDIEVLDIWPATPDEIEACATLGD